MIVDQVDLVRLYPRLVMEEDIITLESAVTKEEIFEVLKGMPKKKARPDEWTVEFYTSYFYLVANDFLQVIEEACLKGEVIRSFNSNFIALIPKVNGPTTFGDVLDTPTTLRGGVNECGALFPKTSLLHKTH
jgi:hypothetical protein